MSRLSQSSLLLILAAGQIACTPSPPPSASAIYDMVSPSVVKVYGLSAQAGDNRAGTGFVVNLPSGPSLVTNRHIVETAEVVVVETSTSTWAVPWWEEHSSLDIAILPMVRELPALRIGSAVLLRPGTRVFTVGHPLGESLSVHEGIVSAVEGSSMVFSAPLSSGASGSPLLDESGAVVGICHAFVPAAQNYNLALPSDFISMKSGWSRRLANPDPTLEPYLKTVAKNKAASAKNYSSWSSLAEQYPEWQAWAMSTGLTRRPLIAEMEAALSAARAIEWGTAGSVSEQPENIALAPLLKRRASSLSHAWKLHLRNIDRVSEQLPTLIPLEILADMKLIPDAIGSIEHLAVALENQSDPLSHEASLEALTKYLEVEERWTRGLIP